MEVTDIETLAAHMRATGVEELEWHRAGSLLRLMRTGGAQIELDDVPGVVPVATHEHVVRAPAVGTFVATHPVTGELFAAPGTRVKCGDVIALIESAGFLREVLADADGVVNDVLANDASLVEFGQPLLTLNKEISE